MTWTPTTVALTVAAGIAAALRHPDHPRREPPHVPFVEAQRRLPGLTYALPVPAVQARLEMAHAYVGLADHAGARTVLNEIDAIPRVMSQISAPSASMPNGCARCLPPRRAASSALTAAELRILPLMTTHLSYREIGERQFLSRHTVKSHAISIYRMLDVASRNEAVDRAREIGLI